MKKKLRGVGIALCFAIFAANCSCPVSAMTVDGESAEFDSMLAFTQTEAGTWRLEEGRWRYYVDSLPVRNRWVCTAGTDGRKEWYCFDADGNMCTGWQKSSGGNWYYLRETPDSRMGAMERGFLLEPADGRIYYLDPDTGAMRTGYVTVDGKEYYFSVGGGSASWYWDAAQKKWQYSGTGSRPCGSMYVNERTPDGRFADASGVCSSENGDLK